MPKESIGYVVKKRIGFLGDDYGIFSDGERIFIGYHEYENIEDYADEKLARLRKPTTEKEQKDILDILVLMGKRELC